MTSTQTNPLQLHVLPTFDIGGLGSLAIELILAWPYKARHICVAPHYRATKPALIGRLKEIGIQPADIIEVQRNAMKPMAYVEEMHTATIRRVGSDRLAGVVHYNFGDAVWNAMWIRRFWKGTIVSHVGTVLPNDERCQKIVKAPPTETSCFVPASQAVAKSLEAVGCPYERFGPTVWNGVDLTKWHNDSRVHKLLLDRAVRLNEPATHVSVNTLMNVRSPVRFVFVGRMAPEAKDFELLIRGFSAMPSREEAELILIGDGPKRKEYEALTKSLGNEDRVKFLGELNAENTRAELSRADCFVMSALPIEGMSIALVEAIAMGLPIIATDVPANREVLAAITGPGHSNLLVGRQPEMMAGGLELMLDLDMRTVAARETEAHRVHFDIKRVAGEYARLCAVIPELPIRENAVANA